MCFFREWLLCIDKFLWHGVLLVICNLIVIRKEYI